MRNDLEKEFVTNLIAAVLDRAAADYKIALKKKYYGDVEKLETFFLSPEGQTLSRGRGQLMIDRLRQEVEDENRRSNESIKAEERAVHSRACRKSRYFRIVNTRVRKGHARS